MALLTHPNCLLGKKLFLPTVAFCEVKLQAQCSSSPISQMSVKGKPNALLDVSRSPLCDHKAATESRSPLPMFSAVSLTRGSLLVDAIAHHSRQGSSERSSFHAGVANCSHSRWNRSRQAGKSLGRGKTCSAAAAFQGLNISGMAAAQQSSSTGQEQWEVTGAGERKEFAWPDSQRPRICILGGGFGGLYTALRLESLMWPPGKRPHVVLVDQADRFVFKPLLYEILSKEADVWEVAPRFKDLLNGTDVMFIQDTVKAVAPLDAPQNGSANPQLAEAGRVTLGSGEVLSYDWLVLALGAESRLTIVPGAQEFALPFATLSDALEAERRLKLLERQRFGPNQAPIQVAVVGGGYSGVELASTVSQRLGSRGRVTVIDPMDDICASAPSGNREAAKKVLATRGVETLLGYRVTSVASSVSPGGAVLNLTEMVKEGSEGTGVTRQIEADLVLWTVGSRAMVPSGEDVEGGEKPFPLTGRGQADTDETLRVRDHPRVFALGDSASVRNSAGAYLPPTAQVAFQQADYVGWNLWAAINGRPLLPFRYQHLGEMMTLGTSDGAVSLGFLDNVTLEGPVAHAARKVAYLYRMPTNEHKVKVSLSWLAKAAADTISIVQNNVLANISRP